MTSTHGPRFKTAWILGWMVAAVPLPGCLLFTDHVNAPPAVTIDGPDQLHRGEHETFSATVVDDTRRDPGYDWFEADACPPDLATAQRSGRHLGSARTQEGGPPASESSPTEDPGYCLWVVVTDADGARGYATRPIEIRRRTLVLEGPASVTSGQPAVFTASYREEQEREAIDQSSLSWAKSDDCDSAVAAAVAAPAQPGLVRFQYDRASRRAFCVAAVAHDEFGVEHPGTLMVSQPQITVTGPPADIHQVQPARRMIADEPQPMGIFSDVRLAAAAADDLDPDETWGFTWNVIRPDGTAFIPASCTDARPPGSEVCFSPELPGTYQAQVIVTDGTLTASAPTFSLQVADLPPCIRDTEPLFASAPKLFEYYDRALIFRVRAVQDDGDPLPPPARATQHAFRWSLRKQGAQPAGFERRVSATFSDFTVPAHEYQPGDRIDVRVEYWDRLDLADPTARDVGSHCDPEAATCELIPGSKCYQWITWTVEYL